MSLGPTCGLWPGARGLVGAIIDAEGLLMHEGGLHIGESEGSEAGWLSHAEARYGPGIELVVTLRLARHNPVSRLAVELGYRVWVAPSDLVGLVASAAWYRPSPRQMATVLARLPRTRAARALLRRLPRDPGLKQLRLF